MKPQYFSIIGNYGNCSLKAYKSISTNSMKLSINSKHIYMDSNIISMVPFYMSIGSNGYIQLNLAYQKYVPAASHYHLNQKDATCRNY